MSELGDSFRLFISADCAGICPYTLGCLCRLSGNNAIVKGVSRKFKLFITTLGGAFFPVIFTVI